MSEHPIQLRRAWDLLTPDGAVRVDLPTAWGPRSGSFRLARSFRRPRIDPRAERLILRLRDVAGLRALRLNDREAARPAPGTTTLELELTADLPERNRLELEVEPDDWSDPEAPWGTIALVIQPL